MQFEENVKFAVGLDAQDRPTVVAIQTMVPGLLEQQRVLMVFKDLQQARLFFQGGVDFCDKHQTKVPDVFIEAMKDDGDNGGEVGAKLEPA